ncbi:hypothetical protein AAUPMB_11168, partial [Pasteurella multocida subsp. multocida str. Anand1_buffalo]
PPLTQEQVRENTATQLANLRAILRGK